MSLLKVTRRDRKKIPTLRKGLRKCLLKPTELPPPPFFFIQVITTLFLPFRSAFFLFCSEHRPKIKSEHPGLSIGDTAKKLGEMWSEQSAKDKQPYEQKAAKLKEKYEKDIAAYRAKGKSEAGKKGPGRPTGSKKKNEPEDEEEEDEDEEEEEEDEE